MKKIKIKNPLKKIKNPFKAIRRKWKGWSKRKKIISSVIAVVLICAIVTGVVFGVKRSGNQMPTMTTQTQEATVTTGIISNTVVGTGTLEADTSISVTVPSGVTIKKVKVESGDSVSAGDALATVDSASVLEAIETVQDEIDELDEEINDYEDSDDTEAITSKVSGTVKKIYVSEGDSVTDCIAENGALLIIKLDSGEKIKITSDGGTVTEVNVSKNDEVSSGDTLLTVETDEESAEYKKLIEERKALEKTMKKLVNLSQTGKIVAEEDGVIGSVNVSEGSESSAASGSSAGGTADSMSYSSTGGTVTNLTSRTSSATTGKSTTATSFAVTALSETTTTSDDTKIELEITGSGSTTKSNLVVAQPITGNTPQTTVTTTDSSYTGTIEWSPDDSAFQTSITYTATVTLNAKNDYAFSADSITKIYTGLISGITVSNEGKTITFAITFPATADSETETTGSSSDSTSSSSSDSSSSQSATSDGTTKSTNNTTDSTYGSTNSGSSDSTISSSSDSTINTSGSSSASATTSASDSSSSDSSTNSTSDSEYSTDVTAFTMASNDTMILAVSVDELDINSMALDQKATVTMDAIEDTEFMGTVTGVGNSATSSGSGVAKYTVEITIPKDSQMKEGMNASATITIESKENILTLPVDALQERGNSVFVYTEKDSDGNLSGEVEVTTGLSDGNTVEITEGLSEGDTVYYQRIGTSSDTDSSSDHAMGGKMDDMMSGEGGGGRGGFDSSDGNSGGMPSGGGGMSQGGME